MQEFLINLFYINSDYFEQNGGYKFAKRFYEKAFRFAEREMGADNIISAVMHAVELNNEEYNFLENLRNELYHKLSKMNKEELIEYFKSLYPEKNLNFKKQINGKTYKVNTYFNENSEYTILQILFEILRK